MKLVVVGPTYPFRGGIAHYTTLLCRELSRQHELYFFSFRRQYPRWLFKGRTDRDPSQSPLQIEARRWIDPFNPLTWIKTGLAIAALQADAIVIQWWVTFWAPVWVTLAALARARSKARILFLCHNIFGHESNWLDRQLARWALRQGQGFIAQSPEQAALLRELLPGKPVVYCPHPSYRELACRQDGHAWERAQARQRLGLGDYEHVVLFFGFVRPYKGLQDLLGALPRVLEQMPVTLLVAGEFWEGKANCLEQIKRLGLDAHVQILDEYIPDEEIGMYFAAADLVALPYRSVTGSGILQIAFGVGKPVVAARVGALATDVQHEQTGLLVPPQAPQAMADAITRFFQDNALRSRLEANVSVEQDQFAWARLAECIAQLAHGETT